LRGPFDKIEGMKRDAAKILEEALKLPVEARAALAGSLIESLDEAVDENVEAAWADEIAQRIADLDSGKAKTIPWSKARRLILSR
jgi:putative addiction module component (TIGR02574 family)